MAVIQFNGAPTGVPPYCFWVQDYPIGPTYEAAPALKAGDNVFVEVDYLGNSLATAFLENETTGQYTTVPFNAPYFSKYYVEWVSEQSSYSNWGPVNFWGCGYSSALNGSCVYFNSLNLHPVIFNGPGNGSVVPTQPPGTGSFTLNTP